MSKYQNRERHTKKHRKGKQNESSSSLAQPHFLGEITAWSGGFGTVPVYRNNGCVDRCANIIYTDTHVFLCSVILYVLFCTFLETRSLRSFHAFLTYENDPTLLLAGIYGVWRGTRGVRRALPSRAVSKGRGVSSGVLKALKWAVPGCARREPLWAVPEGP